MENLNGGKLKCSDAISLRFHSSEGRDVAFFPTVFRVQYLHHAQSSSVGCFFNSTRYLGN